MYLLIIGQAERFRAHLCIGGVRALTDLRLADLKIDRAVKVQLQAAGGGLQRNGIDGGVVPEGRKADAAADGAGLVGVGLDLFLVADGLHALFHTLPVGVLVKLVVREAVHIAGLHQILPAVVQRRHADGLCTLLRVGFVRERCLRHTVAAHGARRRAVGEHGIGVALKIGAGIMLVERAERLGDDGVAVRGVGALIGEALDLLGGDGAILAEPRNDVNPDGVADAVGDEGLLARAVEADAAASDLRAAPCAQRLIQAVLLVAEAAADVRLDDADIAPWAAKRLSDDTAHNVRDLRGAGHDQTTVFFIAEAAVVLDVAVLHGGGVIPALGLDEARLLNCLGIIADGHGRVLENVVGEALMQLRRAVLHGLLCIQHERQLLIFHLDGANGLHRRDLIFRDDRAHIVAVVAHMPVQQIAVGDVLMSGIHRPRVARRRERDIRNVEAGEDLHHTLDLFRLAQIDRFHEAVRNCRVLDAHIQRIRRHQILIIFCSAGRLVKGVHTDFAVSYDAHCVPSIICVSCFSSVLPVFPEETTLYLL